MTVGDSLVGIRAQSLAEHDRHTNDSTSDTNDLVAADIYIEAEIARRLIELENNRSCDLIVCIHPIAPPFDDLIRGQIEDIENKSPSLLVVLETHGGSIETNERIADVFRHHYRNGEVSFLVPNYAMSAGTILVMSGDRIFMDYYSVLGPIDPQIQNRNGQMVPALGYLEKFNQLVAKSGESGLTQAELAFLIEKFDPAELHRFEQAREHSIDLLQKWLVKYKFKNWTVTEDRKIPVTSDMKEQRAKEIAQKLNDTTKWRSHGRGLSIEVLKRELNLLIEDYGADEDLQEFSSKLRNYYRFLQDYMLRRGYSYVLHTRTQLIGGGPERR